MKVLIVGFGSIGQRWARILKSDSDHEIFVWRRRKSNLLISDDLQTAKDFNPAEGLGVIEIDDVNSLPKNFFDIAIICSPIYLHLEDWRKCHDLGVRKILIEKPLFANLDERSLENFRLLKNFVINGEIQIYVGFQSRFHPAIKLIKNLISENAIGHIQYVRSHFGEALPSMHPYEDYRNTHMAKEEEHGGPVACLSHDIDLLHYLFGEIVFVLANSSKFGYLETSVSDSAIILWKQESQKEESKISGDCLLDFITWPPIRKLFIFGTLGTISFDWLSGILEVQSMKIGFSMADFSSIERNDLFKEEFNMFATGELSVDDMNQSLERYLKIAELSVRTRRES